MDAPGDLGDKMTVSSAKEVLPLASVVIPNYNGAVWLQACLESLARQEFQDFEVILVDNGSTDGSTKLAQKVYPQLELIAFDTNRGFAVAVNQGIKRAGGEYVALLNSDTVVQPDWLGALVRTLDASLPEVGAVASKMLLMDTPHLIDDAGDILCWTGAAEKVGHGQPADSFTESREIFSPSGGATLYRKRFLDELGGFDEAYFAYLEDVDLGMRGRLHGYRYLFEPSAEVLHKGYGSRITKSNYVRLMTRNRLMLFLKSIPTVLLIKHVRQLLYGQLYFVVVYRKPLDSLVGYFSFMRCLPHALRERRKAGQLDNVSNERLEALLSVETSAPTLRQLLTQRWRSLFS
jgi:GT2 family glycosyltransferase